MSDDHRNGGQNTPSARVLVVFYSRSGNCEDLANAIAEGARAAGAEVRVRRVREVVGPEIMARAQGWIENAERMNALYEAPTLDDLRWADGLALGSPTRFGAFGSELRAFLDSLGSLWIARTLYGKPACVFTSTSNVHGGNETTLLTAYTTLVHFGMVIVPPGYGDPVMLRGGTPYGASSCSQGALRAKPTVDDLEAARFQGKRIAEVSRALAHDKPR